VGWQYITAPSQPWLTGRQLLIPVHAPHPNLRACHLFLAGRTMDNFVPVAFLGLPRWLSRVIARPFHASVSKLAQHILAFRSGG
jgi:hypothetical protein